MLRRRIGIRVGRGRGILLTEFAKPRWRDFLLQSRTIDHSSWGLNYNFVEAASLLCR